MLFIVIVVHMNQKRVLIVSALFPPDIAEPAPYIKELTSRLSSTNPVAVLTYGSLPEVIPEVTINTVSKRLPSFIRLFLFTIKLIKLGKQYDTIFLHNAPSTELPLLFAGSFLRDKICLIDSDQKIIYTGWRKLVHQAAMKEITCSIQDNFPLPKPEIHPFRTLSKLEEDSYEDSWSNHLTQIYPLIN